VLIPDVGELQLPESRFPSRVLAKPLTRAAPSAIWPSRVGDGNGGDSRQADGLCGNKPIPNRRNHAVSTSRRREAPKAEVFDARLQLRICGAGVCAYLGRAVQRSSGTRFGLRLGIRKSRPAQHWRRFIGYLLQKGEVVKLFGPNSLARKCTAAADDHNRSMMYPICRDSA